MSDFSDKPLVAGSLIGLRAFDVDRLGRLVSPQRTTVFTPGENVAECKKSDMDRAFHQMRRMERELRILMRPPVPTTRYATGGMTSATEASRPNPPATPLPARHTAGNIECACGFYAYFDGSNDYKNPDRVSALIEGYGTCTLGTRGFRAEKARLVALIAPGKKFPDDGRVARLVHNYPDVTVYSTKAAAIEAHPLTPPAIPTPETHPDFWSMAVPR